MKCKLCLEDCVLVKSHIIPDFMYRDLFDDKHRIFEAKVNDGELKTKIAQTVSMTKLIPHPWDHSNSPLLP